jgi:hypothetical protein
MTHEGISKIERPMPQMAYSSETTILALFHEWQHLRAAMHFSDDDETAEIDKKMTILENEILAKSVDQVSDLAAKIIVSSRWGDLALPETSHRLWAELRGMVGAC